MPTENFGICLVRELESIPASLHPPCENSMLAFCASGEEQTLHIRLYIAAQMLPSFASQPAQTKNLSNMNIMNLPLICMIPHDLAVNVHLTFAWESNHKVNKICIIHLQWQWSTTDNNAWHWGQVQCIHNQLALGRLLGWRDSVCHDSWWRDNVCHKKLYIEQADRAQTHVVWIEHSTQYELVQNLDIVLHRSKPHSCIINCTRLFRSRIVIKAECCADAANLDEFFKLEQLFKEAYFPYVNA